MSLLPVLKLIITSVGSPNFNVFVMSKLYRTQLQDISFTLTPKKKKTLLAHIFLYLLSFSPFWLSKFRNTEKKYFKLFD